MTNLVSHCVIAGFDFFLRHTAAFFDIRNHVIQTVNLSSARHRWYYGLNIQFDAPWRSCLTTKGRTLFYSTLGCAAVPFCYCWSLNQPVAFCVGELACMLLFHLLWLSWCCWLTHFFFWCIAHCVSERWCKLMSWASWRVTLYVVVLIHHCY